MHNRLRKCDYGHYYILGFILFVESIYDLFVQSIELFKKFKESVLEMYVFIGKHLPMRAGLRELLCK